MLNTFNTVRPRPYLNNNRGGLNKTDDGDINQRQEGANGRQQNQGQNQNQTPGDVVVRGRASQHMAQHQMNGRYQNAPQSYPVGYTPYQRPNYPSANQAPMRQTPPMQGGRFAPVQNDINQASAGVAKRSNRVNIAQILKDFRNTIKAIATPPDLEAQVEEYLQLVEMHVKRPNPNIPIVQNNLKTAAQMLDRYITETLKKESRVVQNWLEALFLQQVDYSFNENDVNESFLVKFPQNQQKPQQPQQQKEEEVAVGNYEPIEIPQEEQIDPFEVTLSVDEDIQKTFTKKPHITVIPQDTRLKSLFIEAKKHAYEDNPKMAMQIFKEAFYRAEELKDYETQSRICLEVGKIYDDNDYYVQALNSYRNSLNYTTDNTVRTQAHLSMAKIYDVNQVEPAIDHYLVSVSYAGETDDIVTQSTSLAKIGNLLTDKYDKQCFEFYEEAQGVIASSNDVKAKGFISSATADAYSHFNFADTALKYYADAVQNYTKAGDFLEMAQNYKSAAKLMMDFKNRSKASSLLQKALTFAYKAENEELINEINIMFADLTSK